MSLEVQPHLCEYTAVCTAGPSSACGRGAGRPGFVGCLCPCHPDGIAHPKPDNWEPSPLHRKAIDALQVLADANDLEACDPGGECYFPRCLADGCEAARTCPSTATEPERCSDCDGIGKVGPFGSHAEKCQACGGSGERPSTASAKCGDELDPDVEPGVVCKLRQGHEGEHSDCDGTTWHDAPASDKGTP